MLRVGKMVAALSILLGLIAVGPSVSAWAQGATSEPFVVAVAPHTSARVIIEQYQPLRTALAPALKQPVEIVTAPDFTEFARRALAGEYDVAITTGHQAELLRADAGYLPLVTYQADFRAVLVVSRESPVRKADSLNGSLVLGLNPSSLVTLWGLNWLREHRITPREVRFVSAADSVAQLLLAGDAVAGFMSLANFQKLPTDVQVHLRIQESSEPMAGRVYMLSLRHADMRGKIMTALNHFATSPEGRAYFRENRLEGYRDIGEGELKTMARYADEVRQVLKGSAP